MVMKSRLGNTRMLSGKEGMAADAAGTLIKPVTPRVIAAVTPRARFTPFRDFTVPSFNRPLFADCRGITAPCAEGWKGLVPSRFGRSALTPSVPNLGETLEN